MLFQTRVKLLTILSIIALDTVWLISSHFSFDVGSLFLFVVIFPLLLLARIFYSHYRPYPNTAGMLSEMCILILFSSAASVFSYLVTSLNFPLIDEFLVAVDLSMGFDWIRFVRSVNNVEWLGSVSTFFYNTSLVQMILVLAILPRLDQLNEAREFVSSVMFSGILCILISGVLPAAGALAYYQPPPEFLQFNLPTVDLAYKQEFFSVRSGELSLISFNEPKGLIAFPSYHAAVSVIIVAAFRKIPLLFVPFLIINLCVLISTPVDGGHHLIDVIGGIAVALFSIFCMQLFYGRSIQKSERVDVYHR